MLYTDAMKTLITTLTTLLLATSFSFAQKGKILKQVLKPQQKTWARSVKKTSKGATSRRLKIARRTARPGRTADLVRLGENLNLPHEVFNNHIPPFSGDNMLARISQARALSPLKEFINREVVFQKWYTTEIKTANALLTRIANMKANGSLFTNEAAMQNLQTDIRETVTAALYPYLLEDIANRDYSSLIKNLADYYTLPRNYAARQELGYLARLNTVDAFATAAVSYLTRHPHSPNFKWRILMGHPAVDAQTKKELQVFINQNSLSETELNELHALLKDAYIQYATALTALQQAPEIQTSIQVYEECLANLKDFISQNGRLPEWNGINAEERNLYQEISIFTQRDDILFEPLKSLAEEIKNLLAQYEPAHLAFEDTFAQLQAFCNTHHRLPANNPADPNVSAGEADLYNQFIYWELNGSLEQRNLLRQMLRTIYH